MKHVIGFFGGDSQVGTTMIAQSVAELLKERGKRVLLIRGSGKYGGEFAHAGARSSLDDLKAGIRSGKISEDDLDQVIEEVKGIWVLPSVRNPMSVRYFPENTYEVMLASAGEEFDYIVIDGGEDANSGLMISALNISDDRFFITTQQSKSVHRFLLLQKNVLEPLQLQGQLIINKYVADPALFLKQDVLSLCGREAAFTVPYIEYGWQAEMEGRTLLHFSRFAKALGNIADIFVPVEKRAGVWKKSFA